jgi:hypothetical protein
MITDNDYMRRCQDVLVSIRDAAWETNDDNCLGARVKKCLIEINTLLESRNVTGPTDAQRIEWLESIMRPRDCIQIYLAGLRSGDAEATAFQVEADPQKLPTVNGKTLREAIDNAMWKDTAGRIAANPQQYEMHDPNPPEQVVK